MTDPPAPRPGDERTSPPVPATANSDAIAVMGLELTEQRTVTKKTIYSWALWDWATQPFNSVILTFIFVPLYLTSEAFLPASVRNLDDADPAKVAALADLSSGFGLATTIAGLVVLFIAPVLGQQADAAGRHKLWLGIGTGGLVVSMLLLWFVEPTTSLFWLGVSLIAAGQVLGEIAAVNSNAMLVGVATPKTVGSVSGLGWGFGYIGGIIALVLVVIFYSADWFGLSEDGGLPFRIIALVCAVWAIVFSIPIFAQVPEPSGGRPERKANFLRAYVTLARDVVGLYRSPDTRHTFWFLLASAVFRDGLAGVFTFGAIIAAQVFGFGFLDLVIFGIAANLIAGLSTILAGRLDDRFGPKILIVSSLSIMIVAGLAVFLLADGGTIVFWIGGLILCACVGPAQAAARSFLARVTPAGREGEIFGLYATTGRAASWISSLAWTALVALTQTISFGVLGLVSVLVIGLVLLLPVRLTGGTKPTTASTS